MVYIQLRKTAVYIVEQHITASDNAELRRLVFLVIVVEQIGNAVKGNCSFSASRNSLDNDIFIRYIPDNFILLSLNSRDNIAQNSLLVLREIFNQKLVIGSHIVIVKSQKRISVYIVGSLPVQTDFHRAASRNVIAALSQLIFIVDIGSRSAPVHDDHIRLILCDAVFSNITCFIDAKGSVLIVNAPEVGFFQRGSVFSERILGVFQNIAPGNQKAVGVTFPLFHRLVQFLYLPLIISLLLFIERNILLNH